MIYLLERKGNKTIKDCQDLFNASYLHVQGYYRSSFYTITRAICSQKKQVKTASGLKDKKSYIIL